MHKQSGQHWELREAGACSVRTKSSKILAVKIKEVSAEYEQPVIFQSYSLAK